MTGMAAAYTALVRAGPAPLRTRILRTPEGDRLSRSAIFRRLRPSARSVTMRSAAEGSRTGRPSVLPFARAFASPARTRSTSISRSNVDALGVTDEVDAEAVERLKRGDQRRQRTGEAVVFPIPERRRTAAGGRRPSAPRT